MKNSIDSIVRLRDSIANPTEIPQQNYYKNSTVKGRQGIAAKKKFLWTADIEGYVKQWEYSIDYDNIYEKNNNILEHSPAALELHSNWGQLHQRKIASLIVMPCEKFLLTMGSDGHLRQWKVETKQMVRDYSSAGHGNSRHGVSTPMIRNKQFNA
jgi:WD40 repeat protein